MKPEELYQGLKDLAEKLDVAVSERNLRKPGAKVKSGLCKIKGAYCFIMDKHLSLRDKNELLAACLKDFISEDIYVIPAVRDFINKSSD